MKFISRIYRNALLPAMAMLGALTTSCTDYLTIIPSNMVVEEKFWQTKDQVNGMLATSYLELLSTDAVTRAIVWGESRSDNMTFHATSYNSHIKDIIEANATDENDFARWDVFYRAISQANLVLETADVVLDRDPDFTEGDRDVVKGEMYAMRALCHFYLVRSFRDIPLAYHSAKNDADIPDYVQVTPLVALDSIMVDLDRAERLVMKSGAYSTREQNYGRITRNAVLAMKADVNLWRAAFTKYAELNPNSATADKFYAECVQNCRAVIANMDKLLEEENEGKIVEVYPYNLIPNIGEKEDKEKEKNSTSYAEIFGSKNSQEAIFELQVEGTNITNNHARGIINMYGTEDKNNGKMIVPDGFVKSTYDEDDLRAYAYTNLKDYKNATSLSITKYSAKSSPASKGDYRSESDYDANWIIYRKSDVLLMLAEALVSKTTTSDAELSESFEIVHAIDRRSRFDTAKVVFVKDEYMEPAKMQELVRKERLRELSYEGKRWYDLVRLALCENNTNSVKFVADRLTENSAVVKTKMSNIDALFMPIHINELRFNKNLKQNPAYKQKETGNEMN